MRRPRVTLEASSSRALFHSMMSGGKRDSSSLTPSGVLGLVHDSEMHECNENRAVHQAGVITYHAEFDDDDNDCIFKTSSKAYSASEIVVRGNISGRSAGTRDTLNGIEFRFETAPPRTTDAA